VEDQTEIKIGAVEMALRESLREIGEKSVGAFFWKMRIRNGKASPRLSATCGGKLKYQRKRPATIWSVFGKVKYERAY